MQANKELAFVFFNMLILLCLKVQLEHHKLLEEMTITLKKKVNITTFSYLFPSFLIRELFHSSYLLLCFVFVQPSKF